MRWLAASPYTLRPPSRAARNIAKPRVTSSIFFQVESRPLSSAPKLRRKRTKRAPDWAKSNARAVWTTSESRARNFQAVLAYSACISAAAPRPPPRQASASKDANRNMTPQTVEGILPEPSHATAPTLLQVELVRIAQFVARVHLLLENSQIIPNHDDLVASTAAHRQEHAADTAAATDLSHALHP